MKSHKDKQLLFSILFLGLCAGLGGHFIEAAHLSFPKNTGELNQATALLATEQNLTLKTSLPSDITLGFVGDIMLDRGVRAKVVKYFGGDYSQLFTNAGFLKDPDIMFANLEGPASDQGIDKHNLYSFRMDPNAVPILANEGIDVVSFANNHVGDWGRPAFEDTLARLQSAGIQSCGAGLTKAAAEQPAIFSKDGFTVGFICFSDVGPNDMAATDTQSGILLASDPDFDAIVSDASKKVDALIVSFHFGVEYQTTHTARQEQLAKEAVDDGATLVVGGHPHVPEDMTTYKGAPIFYSLGNFIFDQPFSKDTMGGLFVTATLNGKTVSNVVPHQVVLDKNFAPSLSK